MVLFAFTKPIIIKRTVALLTLSYHYRLQLLIIIRIQASFFVLFVQIPYNLSDEENVFSKINERNTNNTTSKLTFFSIGKLGEPVFSPVNVDKSFEGKMIMFSAKQFHGVYPFYTSDNYRITVSGNLKFKTYGNNDI